jgi:uncharacterized protein YjbJ (UPF0337 family)
MCIAVSERERVSQQSDRRRSVSSTDETKGRIKQAAGDLTGDKDLKREGEIDEAGGKAKEKADKLVDKVADSLKND